jgi:hypothetical protein
MTSGFKVQASLEQKNIIKSIRNSYYLKNLDLPSLRREWDRDFSSSIARPFTEEKLFTSSEYLYERSDFFSPYFERITLGFWSLKVEKNPHYKSPDCQEWNFTISVSCGNIFTFHPLQARANILKYHSQPVFDKWKSLVKNDLNRFRDLISSYNPPCHIFSPACSRSSEIVCKRLGIEVHSGIAYLIHSKNRECLHKKREYEPLDLRCAS